MGLSENFSKKAAINLPIYIHHIKLLPNYIYLSTENRRKFDRGTSRNCKEKMLLIKLNSVILYLPPIRYYYHKPA